MYFENGLEIGPDFVRLGDKTWAGSAIREVGVSPGSSGNGIFWGAPLGVVTLWAALAPARNPNYPLRLLGLAIAGAFLYFAYNSYASFRRKRVWFKTGIAPVSVLMASSAQAEEARRAIEDIMASGRR